LLLLLPTLLLTSAWASERPVKVGQEEYILRLTPLVCESGKQVCGTKMLPRRFRGEVVKNGKVVGRFDKPCAEVCEDLERTVARAVRK